LNLDTGAVSVTGGDIFWDGVVLRPQGRAGLYNLGKHGARVFEAIKARHAVSVPYGPASIPASALVEGNIFGVHTNGGQYAKVILTSSNATSLSLQYTTFTSVNSGLPRATNGPVITSLLNNYSYTLPGLPNYGIAPGSIFVIFGAGLSTPAPPVLQSSAAPGLPKTLNQTSVSVTVNGVTTAPALYYASATAVAAVLPSSTPVGNGTVTVTYNGQTSAPAPIQVVTSAVGLNTRYGTGTGAAVVSDANFKLIDLANSATPGQSVTMWGSGIGADSANDDRTYPQGLHNLTNVPAQVFIGGISASLLYGGRSQFPGLDQYNVVVPPNVSPGCYVSVVVQTGSVVSNTVTLPVSVSGGVCTDSASGLNGSQLQALANKSGGRVNSMGFAVGQTIQTGRVSPSLQPGWTARFSDRDASQGSCTVVPQSQNNGLVHLLHGTLPSGTPSIFGIVENGLDAGESIRLTGPHGTLNLTSGGGFYGADLPEGATPGTYTFVGNGGKDVGAFTIAINLPAPPILTNPAALASVTRAQGATFNWTGGFPGGDVQVEGWVHSPLGFVRFYCHAPSEAGQLVVPPSILLAFPPGAGGLSVTNTTAPQKVLGPGLDVGLAAGTVTFYLDSTFK
jgi:uncharacterized protein (TIGR03437 family)